MTQADPDFSVLTDERLVAYLWRKSPGRIYRGQRAATLAECPFAEMQLFDSKCTDLLLQLASNAPDFDALLFRIGMEGLTVRPGAATPASHRRRF